MSSADLPGRKPIRFLHGEIKTPPIGAAARKRIGFLLGLVQAGRTPGMPASRPMPDIGPNVYELRVGDDGKTWRVVYQVRADIILIVDVFSKRTRATPKQVIDRCRERLRDAE